MASQPGAHWNGCRQVPLGPGVGLAGLPCRDPALGQSRCRSAWFSGDQRLGATKKFVQEACDTECFRYILPKFPDCIFKSRFRLRTRRRCKPHTLGRQEVITRAFALDFKTFIDDMFVTHPRPKKSILPPLSKKRKTAHSVEEISFDTDARQEYLTGFHKRKVQRVKRAQEEAAKRERQEKLQTRKQV